MRPLRGGQGTFDKIIRNIRAGRRTRRRIAIGGNFEMETADSYPALLDFLKEQDFADQLSKVAFKPVIRERKNRRRRAPAVKGAKFIPLTAVGRGKPLERRVHDVGAAPASQQRLRQLQLRSTTRCRSCARRRRSAASRPSTACTWARARSTSSNAHTIGPDGSLFACPGFAGEAQQSTGHIDGRAGVGARAGGVAVRGAAAWKECSDCAFIPVCAGGCTVAAHTELGNMNKPNCHKTALQAGLVSLAREAARRSRLDVRQLVGPFTSQQQPPQGDSMKNNEEDRRRTAPSPLARRRRRRQPAVTDSPTSRTDRGATR